jgi:FtsP/CotA-like multicopper oxidase with cupredoxin domain
MNGQLKRREFLKIAGLAAGGTGAVLLSGKTASVAAQDHTAMPAMQMSDWQQMDAHHQAGVDIYLANIGADPTFWDATMPYEMDGDTKVFHITCTEADWDTGGGVMFPAMMYNGRVPGPDIRVTEGDRCRFIVRNDMTAQSTAVHWHGLRVPNDQDGVPFITQPIITPGMEYTYEFTVVNPGSHMYHSHHNAAEQVTKGLLGAFIVEPLDRSRVPEVAADYTFVLNDSSLGFTFNGKGFPYTQPIIAQLGDRIRVRYFNEGLMIHPMHLHGLPQLVIEKDGYPLPAPYLCDTLNIAPGERYDVLVECDLPGVWAYHCHILSHAEGPNGMFGMVTALVVQE